MDLVKRAEEIAEGAHKGQFRRDGVTPYIEHPRAVVSRVGNDPVAHAAAWLHDTIEDTDETAKSLLEKGIPQEVVEAVELLSKPKGADYLDFVKGAMVNPIAHKVKVADIMANLTDDPSPGQIRKYAQALLVLVSEE